MLPTMEGDTTVPCGLFPPQGVHCLAPSPILWAQQGRAVNSHSSQNQKQRAWKKALGLLLPPDAGGEWREREMVPAPLSSRVLGLNPAVLMSGRGVRPPHYSPALSLHRGTRQKLDM